GLAVKPNGELLYQSSKFPKLERFTDKDFLDKVNAARQNAGEGFENFSFNNESYFGIYKYNSKWDMYLLRAEERTEFYAESTRIFRNISFIIILITLACAGVGIFLIREILRFVGVITKAIMKMSESQHLQLIDMKGATNDEVTYLGMAFNSLSSTIDNLVGIFQKFASRDVVSKAYEERQIRLEGKQMDLTILFTDIKGFTTMTETLGTDIIKLLNIHYDKAINHIFKNDGIIGSIIGDALLAVYGAIPGNRNKSMLAIDSAYKVTEVARQVRMAMHERKEELVRTRGSLTPEQEKVYRAVLIEVGVGIDGGQVFYGNIGSNERMTNTVIGDNVNSAARLEGLTRVYKVPVICSEYVKTDIEKNVNKHKMRFVELDLVQVKGKTTGKKVFWPIPEDQIDKKMDEELDQFEDGLKLYFKGDWPKAYKKFAACSLPVASEFADRTRKNKAPRPWNGIWEMKTK
ncbi:MAG: adenylate/guanylate cyclase domain-containing protein, partial [Spirochaetia bacterium]|nr:adenylate/guanylate cyclase domain-containing protein [Spirochaetia bacterium]